MHSLTLRKLVLIGDVTAGHVSFRFGQNHAAHMRGVDFYRLHGPIFTPGVEHHVAVDLLGERRKHRREDLTWSYS